MLNAADVRVSDFDLPAPIANVYFAIDPSRRVTRPILLSPDR
jgi:hypothetical protein